MLPLFPLGTVLFPGLVLPLHVFEPRYRELVQDLLALPEDEREFGVVAIRQGREVGVDGVSALYDVGCTAAVREVEVDEDGTSELLTVGARRFALHEVSYDKSYLCGEVTWLPDELGDAGSLGDAVRSAFEDYLAALSAATGDAVTAPDLPDDDLVLSHLVGATVLLDLPERQSLLAAEDGRARLRSELSVLRREAGILRELGAAPAPELARTPYSLS